MIDESNNRNEYEKERIRGLHLVVVIVYTIAAAAVIGESFLMGWELFMLPLFVVGLFACWWLHISQNLSDNARYYIYVTLIYIVMFFHGIHETSLFDVAITTNLSILLFSQLDNEKVIKIGVSVYAFMLLYQLGIAINRGSIATDSLTVSRMALHIASVILTSRLAITIIKRRKKDTKNYAEILKRMADVNVRTENFMANISHELRTPINVVTGMTSLLLKEEKNPEKLENIESINQAGRRLFDQIGGILDYTEIDTNRLIISNEKYMISSVINDLISEISIFEKEHGLEIIFDVDAELPKYIVGDGRRIKKILYNLIDNAVKFTREGGVYIKVYGMTREYGINICMDVIDTGIGISSEEKEYISQGFYQSDSGRDRRTGGIGLGLPVVYGFVHSMHGFVKIDSNVGQGTKVHVSIPQNVADPSPCISVDNADELCIACYLRPEKYKHPAVRDYYSEMISNMVKGLKVNLHRIAQKEDLDKVFNKYAVTHVFIGAEEYNEDTAYFEEMAQKTKVVIVADKDFSAVDDSYTLTIRKPFYVLPVAAVLNTETVSLNDDDMALANVRPMFNGVKALVVDDEEMNLVVAGGIFRNYGMEVDTAESGMRSVALCEKKDYDIVFMDHMMPEMDGIEAMKLIKEQARLKGRTPAIVALTANAVSGAREMFLEAGFDGFVAKPIEMVELLRVLRTVIPQSKIQYIPQSDIDLQDAVNDTPYIDYGKALTYCGDDKSLLDSLVKIFADEKKNNIMKLKQFMDNDDIEKFEIEMIRLRDEADLLGFRVLYNMLDSGEIININAIDECIDKSIEDYNVFGGAL